MSDRPAPEHNTQTQAKTEIMTQVRLKLDARLELPCEQAKHIAGIRTLLSGKYTLGGYHDKHRCTQYSVL